MYSRNYVVLYIFINLFKMKLTFFNYNAKIGEKNVF